MRRTICDVCGNIIEKPIYKMDGIATRFYFVHFGFFNRSGITDESYEEHDLCSACAETLWNWLHKPPKEDTE